VDLAEYPHPGSHGQIVSRSTPSTIYDARGGFALPRSVHASLPALLRRAIARHEQAIAARESRRLAVAERAATDAAALYARAEGPGHADVANALVDLGQICELRDDLDGAAAALDRARAILARGRQLDDPEIARLSIRAGRFLGSVLRAQADHAGADRTLARVLRESTRRLGARDLDTGAVLNDLGVLRKYQGRFAEAAAFYRRAYTIVNRSEERRGQAAATLYHNLGGLEHSRGRHARGEPYARQSVDLRTALLGADHPMVAADVAALAALVEGQGRLAEAARLYQRALRVFRRQLGPGSSEVAVNLCALGGVRQAQGRLADGEKLIRAALAIQEKLYGRGHPETAMTANNLGILLAGRGRAAEARALCRRAHAIFHRTLGARHPHTRQCAANLVKLTAASATRVRRPRTRRSHRR
jgi:tetratricopeptide (TPR) repeat protein